MDNNFIDNYKKQKQKKNSFIKNVCESKDFTID